MELNLVPLLNLSAIDAPPKFFQSLQASGKFVKKLKESDVDIVNSPANRSGNEEEHGALQSGLLYLALTEPDPRCSYCMDIVLTSRDNLTYVLSEMTRLVAEAWLKMTQDIRQNLINLLSEFIETRGASVEVLILHIFRRMTTGDLSHSNLWLIDTMVGLLEKNKDWLCNTDRQPFLLPLTVYTLLRLIPDHHFTVPPSSNSNIESISLQNLREKELTLVDDLLRRNFDRCTQIGRDLIRLLHGVARLEPIKTLWDNILQNFSSLSSHFSSLSDILEIVTPQCFTQTLIPHEMEQWVRWMMKNVHCVPRVPVHRYQEFFQRRFFSTPESQSLRVCLLRYVVTFFYPDNEMLASTLIPRWNVVSWILSQSTCPVTTVNIKLALFYDWLFFKPNDCIMNLEPALLGIMNHLTPRSQLITFSLVEFLVKIVGNYYPPMTDRIIVSVRNGLEEMIRLGVVKTVTPLFDFLHRSSPELHRSLRVLLGCDVAVPPHLTLPNDLAPPIPTTLSSNVPTVTNTVPVRRLSDAKTKFLSVDSGSPTDPRLTRGHAAILAGAVTPPSNLSNESKSTAVPLSTSLSSPSLAGQLPINTLSGTCTTSSNDDSKSPLLLTSTKNAASSQLLLSTKTAQRVDDSLFSNDVGPSSLPDNEFGFVHIDVDDIGDEDDGDDVLMNVDDLKSTKSSRSATWSPPPQLKTGCSSVLPQNMDRIPDTPESMELKIEDLRRRFQDYQLRFHYFVEPVDANALIEQLDKPIQTALERFRDVAQRIGLVRPGPNGLCASQNLDDVGEDDLEILDDGQRVNRDTSVYLRSATALTELGECMEALIQAVLEEDSFDDLEIAGCTAAAVCELTFGLFAQRLVPIGMELSEEHLEDCLSSPIFIPFRHLWQMSPGDPKCELLLLLLTEMQSRQPRLGYHLLFFLKVSKVNDTNMSMYRNFCASQESPNLRDSLYKDMQLLSDDNRKIFSYLLPDVFTVFSFELADDAAFLRLIMATIDPGMCNNIISEIVRGHLNLFPNNDLTNILNASLEWNSIEQLFFWQLINAHEIPTKRFLPLIRTVDPTRHSEACTNLILLLKLEKPSFELMRALLLRPGSSDLLSMTALHFWSCPDNQHSSRFCSILSSFINAPLTFSSDANSQAAGMQSVRDRRRTVSKNSVTQENYIDLSLILAHLDFIRKNCKNISLLQDDEIQSALQSIAQSPKIAPSLKDRFSDLLALAEDMPSAPPDPLDPPPHRQSPVASTTLPNIQVNGELRTSDSKKSNNDSGGSKGGHSLRNLDSRRAAAAESRRNNLTKRLSSNHLDNHQSLEDEGESDGLELTTPSATEDVLLVSSSSASSDEDDKPKSSSTARLFGSDKKVNNKRSLTNRKPRTSKRSSTSRLIVAEDEDDDDEEEERNLQVVLGDDEMETRRSKLNILQFDDVGDDDEEEDDQIRSRPPKRRKKSIKRFMLDD